MIRRIVGIAVALVLITTGASFADFAQTYLGKTTLGSPTFNRPGQSSPFTLSGTFAHYHVQEFQLPANSTCYIYGAQSFDGYLHLYQGSFNAASPLTNLIAGDDDADLSIGTSQLENLNLTTGHYALVTSGFGSGSVGTFQNSVHCSSAQPLGSPCNGYFWNSIPAEDTICLNNRFLVGIDNVSNSTTGGTGHVVPVASKDTGIFWFYDSDNFEVMIKVLNGCGVNSHWWVFAGALTNQTYRLRVFDTENPAGGGGPIQDYINLFPNQAPAITDINAFSTCP